MSVITRRFSACPVRTASQTWRTIISVLDEGNKKVEKELSQIVGIASAIIADEIPKIDPITIVGSGPRLRIYCLYDEDGSTEDANETSLNWNLFDGDWQIWFPVKEEDMNWISAALKEKGSRFRVYQCGSKIDAGNNKNMDSPVVQQLIIDIEKLRLNE